MEAAIEKVAVLPCGDEAESLDAHTARPAGNFTRQVGLCRGLILVTTADLRVEGVDGNHTSLVPRPHPPFVDWERGYNHTYTQ